MLENKEITVTEFQSRLLSYYIANGEMNVENRVDTLSSAIIRQNKEDNPFVLDIFLNFIQIRDIKLGDLIGNDGSVKIEMLNELMEQAQAISNNIDSNTTLYNNADNISLENKIKLAQINYTKRLSSEELFLIANNFEEWFKTVSEENMEVANAQVFEGQDDIRISILDNLLKLIKADKTPEEMLKWQKELDDESKQQLMDLGVMDDKGNIDKTLIKGTASAIYEFAAQAESIVVQDPSRSNNEIISQIRFTPEQERNLSLFRYNKYDAIITIKENIEKKQERDQLRKYFEGAETHTENIINPKMKTADIFNNNPNKHYRQEIEEMTKTLYLAAPEYASVVKVDKTKSKTDVHSKMDKSPQTSVQQKEEAYVTPIIEDEKTGLAKMIAKMKDSKNPLVQKLAQRLMAFNNRDKARLESPDVERKSEDFSEKPSKVRFDAGDSDLMPTGTGVRNSFIKFGEGIMNIFQRKKKEPQPTRVLVPITPKSFDDSVAVSEEIKNITVSVGLQAGINQSKDIKSKETEQRQETGEIEGLDEH